MQVLITIRRRYGRARGKNIYFNIGMKVIIYKESNMNWMRVDNNAQNSKPPLSDQCMRIWCWFDLSRLLKLRILNAGYAEAIDTLDMKIEKGAKWGNWYFVLVLEVKPGLRKNNRLLGGLLQDLPISIILGSAYSSFLQLHFSVQPSFLQLRPYRRPLLLQPHVSVKPPTS